MNYRIKMKTAETIKSTQIASVPPIAAGIRLDVVDTELMYFPLLSEKKVL